MLQHLVDAHPDLAVEATEIARALLRQPTYEDVAAEMEDELRTLDYDALNDRAGSHEWGYTEPSEAAWEIMEEILEPFVNNLRRHLELGLETEAKEICQGLVLGCYRLSEREGGDVLGWAPDFRAEAAGNALEIWHRGSKDSKHPGSEQKESPPFSVPSASSAGAASGPSPRPADASSAKPLLSRSA